MRLHGIEIGHDFTVPVDDRSCEPIGTGENRPRSVRNGLRH